MIAQQPTDRRSQLALLVYVAALLAVTSCVVANDGAYRELQAAAQRKAEMLEELKKRSSVGTPAAATLDTDAATVAGPSETVAASALQRYLLDRLQRAGGFVQSVQAEPRRETITPGLQRLSAQLAFEASTNGLQRLLFELETGLPYVFVDSLAAQPAAVMSADARAGDKLRVTLTVTSYWKAPASVGAER